MNRLHHKACMLVVVLLLCSGCDKLEQLTSDEKQKQATTTKKQETNPEPGIAKEKTEQTTDPKEEHRLSKKTQETDKASQAREARIKELLDTVTQRKNCNRVMGCPAQEELIELGKPVVEPLVETYNRLSRPNFQKFHLIDIAANIESNETREFLLDCLDNRFWQARMKAAIGLGTLGDSEVVVELKKRLDNAKDSKDRGYVFGLVWSLAKLKDPGHTDILLEGLDPKTRARTNTGYTRVAVDAVADLNMKEACPNLPGLIRHPDLFLAKSSIRAASQLKCKQLKVLNAVASRLEDRVPSVRKESSDALKELTGQQFSSIKSWESYKAWMKERGRL